MTDDQQPDPTADECIRAGMYWFGRSDFVAAEAWWQRAIELEPHNQRAHECLRLLQKTSSTGFKSPTANPFSDPRASRPEANALGANEPAPLDPYGGMDFAASEAPTPARGLVAPTIPIQPQGMSNDPFDFVERGEQLYRTPSSIDSPAPVGVNPWDEGPSRTSVVTVRSQGDFDAVPDPTPLPELDRERFFNRGDPQSREEIVDFLRATGDLPADMQVNPFGEEIVFDDPIEMASEAPTLAQAPSYGTSDLGTNRPVLTGQPVSPPVPQRQTPAQLLEAARDRFQLHDFNGALELLEEIGEDVPESATAKSLIATAQRNLMKMYESKIGDFDRTPRVLISGEEVIWLNLNHRAGFILSQIDGAVTYEDLIALSGMPRLDTVRILADLITDNVIG